MKTGHEVATELRELPDAALRLHYTGEVIGEWPDRRAMIKYHDTDQNDEVVLVVELKLLTGEFRLQNEDATWGEWNESGTLADYGLEKLKEPEQDE